MFPQLDSKRNSAIEHVNKTQESSGVSPNLFDSEKSRVSINNIINENPYESRSGSTYVPPEHKKD